MWPLQKSKMLPAWARHDISMNEIWKTNLNMKTSENSSKPMSKKKVLDLSGSPNFRSTSQKVYRLTPWTLFFVSKEDPGTLWIYRFTVLPTLPPHAPVHWYIALVRISHFTALPSSPVHAVHEKTINLPLYGFTMFYFGFLRFHTSFTVLRFYGFTTFSCPRFAHRTWICQFTVWLRFHAVNLVNR